MYKMLKWQAFRKQHTRLQLHPQKAADLVAGAQKAVFSDFIRQVPEFQHAAQRTMYSAQYSTQNRFSQHFTVTSRSTERQCYRYGWTAAQTSSWSSYLDLYDLRHLLQYSAVCKREPQSNSILLAVKRQASIEAVIERDKPRIQVKKGPFSCALNYNVQQRIPSIHVAANSVFTLFSGKHLIARILAQFSKETGNQQFECPLPAKNNITCNSCAKIALRAEVAHVVSQIDLAVADERRHVIFHVGYALGNVVVGAFKYVGEAGAGVDIFNI